MREALRRLFLGSEIGQGYPGDEDNGELSAWWLFSALGFYPLQAGSPNYAIGSPLFTRAVVHVDGGRDLVVNAPRNSAANVYVQGLRINGRRHREDLVHAGRHRARRHARLRPRSRALALGARTGRRRRSPAAASRRTR